MNVLINQFAIGAMINKTSINLREIYPSKSQPAEILDQEIVFFGAATAIAQKGKSGHGVIHSITPEEFDKLDLIESGYNRLPAKAKLQDGTIVDCFVYSFKDEILNKADLTKSKPSERQMEIIEEGCKYQGVKQEWIDQLKSIEFDPRTPESEFKPVEFEDESLAGKQQSKDELRKLNGEDGRDAAFVMCGQVFKATKFTKKEHQGKDITMRIIRMLQDPKYGAPNKLEDISEMHKQCLLNRFRSFRKAIGMQKSDETDLVY